MIKDDTWMVVFDTTSCHFYQKNRHHLKEIACLHHPENRNKDRVLGRDRPGHYQTTNGARGAYSTEANFKEHQIQHFMHEIREFLKRAHHRHQFKDLILVAEPRMMGRLMKEAGKKLNHLIQKHINKNWTHRPANEMKLLLQKIA